MKLCPSCAHAYDSARRDCPRCGFVPATIDGLDAYAPEQARGGAGFKEHYFSELAAMEDANFWFRARNELLVWMLRTYAPRFQSLLEMGCGTGYVLSELARTFPQAKLFGSELFTAGLDIAARRVPSAVFFQMDARKVPFVDEFDVVAVLDVLEHIDEDEAVLAQIHGALKNGGTLLVTVPQHKWLWSATDTSSCHVRRYAAAKLHRKIEAAGFTLVRSTSFVSLLLPLMVFSRMIMHQKAAPGADSALDEMKISPWLNGFFFHILRIEQIALRRGLDFPLGGSRLVVARKSSN